jgi:glucose-1-phosphate cytidylyltransferase
VIKNFFLQFADMASDLTIDLATGTVERRRRHEEAWKVHLVDTGHDTLTGGRLLRLAPIISAEPFMLTYGDGLSNVPLDRLLAYHRSQGKLATVTAVPALARFGNIVFAGDRVTDFVEKRTTEDAWINGGFMVMEPGVFDYLDSDDDVLEVDLLERLTADRELAAFRHRGFWQCMDTLRDKQGLERLWLSGAPPWKRW